MSNKDLLDSIKKLREMTGVGFNDCKIALDESKGDIEKSVEFLRKKGIAKASKKMSRTASEGLALVLENKGEISIIEVNNSILNAEWNFHNATYNDSKGLQALDYLLHKPGYSDLQLVNYYSSNVNAKEYLKAIIDDLMVNINYVNDEWINHKSNFINDFEINNSGFSSNSQGSSISNIINALCLHYEFYVRRGKIGLPLGVFNGFSQQELPHLVECYFSGKSLQNTARCINSIRNFINGSGYINNDNGLGLDDYMNFVNAEYNNMQLSKVIDNQIVTILEELNNYNNPLSDEIINNKNDLLNSYEELQKLVPFIKVDMTSGLGVLITYQDNDGD